MNFYMWWWSDKGNRPNFGDAINPYLVRKLGNNIKPQYVSRRPYKECLIFVLSALKKIKRPEMGHLRKLYRFNHYALCIGSILKDCKSGQTVWGSGFMNQQETIKGGKILAVRGYETLNCLKQQGFQISNIVGDPAILLPLVYTPPTSAKYEYGFIPHIKDYQRFIGKYNYPIINLQTDNIENVINQINECKMIFSTSLHGLIISHAYGIPAIWIKAGNIGTDGFKFKDYFSSVNIPYYSPIKLEEFDLNSFHITEVNKNIILPKNDIIKKIQTDLLSCAPFPLKSQYKVL